MALPALCVDGMDLQETASYITHHLQIAGRSGMLFSDDAVALLHQTSRGSPGLPGAERWAPGILDRALWTEEAR